MGDFDQFPKFPKIFKTAQHLMCFQNTFEKRLCLMTCAIWEWQVIGHLDYCINQRTKNVIN